MCRLELLPDGQVVIWNKERLGGAPAGGEFPADPDVVQGIAELCERRGIRLGVLHYDRIAQPVAQIEWAGTRMPYPP